MNRLSFNPRKVWLQLIKESSLPVPEIFANNFLHSVWEVEPHTLSTPHKTTPSNNTDINLIILIKNLRVVYAYIYHYQVRYGFWMPINDDDEDIIAT